MAFLEIGGLGVLGQDAVEESLAPHVAIRRMQARLARQQVPHRQARLHHGMRRELGEFHSHELGADAIGGGVAVARRHIGAIVDAEHFARPSRRKHDGARAAGDESAAEDAIEQRAGNALRAREQREQDASVDGLHAQTFAFFGQRQGHRLAAAGRIGIDARRAVGKDHRLAQAIGAQRFEMRNVEFLRIRECAPAPRATASRPKAGRRRIHHRSPCRGSAVPAYHIASRRWYRESRKRGLEPATRQRGIVVDPDQALVDQEHALTGAARLDRRAQSGKAGSDHQHIGFALCPLFRQLTLLFCPQVCAGDRRVMAASPHGANGSEPGRGGRECDSPGGRIAAVPRCRFRADGQVQSRRLREYGQDARRGQ